MSTTPKSTKQRLPGLLAACILAVLTLGAFFILQDYGPDSAVRRFHEALRRGDPAELQQVVDEPISDQTVQYVCAFVKPLLQEGDQIQLARTDRQGDQDDVVVVYRRPNGQTLAIVWIVDRRASIWKINARLTAEALAESLRPG